MQVSNPVAHLLFYSTRKDCRKQHCTCKPDYPFYI